MALQQEHKGIYSPITQKIAFQIIGCQIDSSKRKVTKEQKSFYMNLQFIQKGKVL